MSDKIPTLKDIDPDMYDFCYKVRMGMQVEDEASIRAAIRGHEDQVYKIITGEGLEFVLALALGKLNDEEQ